MSDTTSQLTNNDFLSSYPFDIIKHIFSFFEQSDALECMRVCRQWSAHIPFYTTELWKQVEFASFDNPNHQRVLQCMGPHVEKLVLRQCSNEQSSTFFYSLASIDCISVREIVIHEGIQPPKISMDALLPIANNLRELTLYASEEDYMDMHYLHVLASCPTITHFTYINFTSTSSRTDDSEPFEAPVVPQLKLKYLHIDAKWHTDKDDYLMVLLRNSPALKCLLVSDLDYEEPNFDSWYTERWPTGYLAKYLDACPNLQYFAWNAWFDEEVEHWKNCIDSNPSNGLLELVMRNVDNYFLKRLMPTMAKHFHTLKVFTIQADYPGLLDWSPLAVSRADQLVTFELSLIQIDGDTLSRIIQSMPSLESIRLEFVESLFTTKVLDALAVIQNLRSLGLRNTFSESDADQYTPLCASVCRFLEKDCPQLQHLELYGRLMVSNYMLQAASNIVTLRKLTLGWRNDPPWNGLNTLLQAIPLEHIELERIYAKDQLAEVIELLLRYRQDSLRGLSISSCQITDNILKTVADHRFSRLENITISRHASLVSEDMISYTKRRLGGRVTVSIQ